VILICSSLEVKIDNGTGFLPCGHGVDKMTQNGSV